MLDEKIVFEYIMTHQNEDFPIEQSLEDFYKKVKEWYEGGGECQMI